MFRSIVSQSCPRFIVSYFSSISSNFRISGVRIGSKPDFSIASGNFAGDAVAMQTLLPVLMKIEIYTVFICCRKSTFSPISSILYYNKTSNEAFPENKLNVFLVIIDNQRKKKSSLPLYGISSTFKVSNYTFNR